MPYTNNPIDIDIAGISAFNIPRKSIRLPSINAPMGALPSSQGLQTDIILALYTAVADSYTMLLANVLFSPCSAPNQRTPAQKLRTQVRTRSTPKFSFAIAA